MKSVFNWAGIFVILECIACAWQSPNDMISQRNRTHHKKLKILYISHKIPIIVVISLKFWMCRSVEYAFHVSTCFVNFNVRQVRAHSSKIYDWCLRNAFILQRRDILIPDNGFSPVHLPAIVCYTAVDDFVQRSSVKEFSFDLFSHMGGFV